MSASSTSAPLPPYLDYFSLYDASSLCSGHTWHTSNVITLHVAMTLLRVLLPAIQKYNWEKSTKKRKRQERSTLLSSDPWLVSLLCSFHLYSVMNTSSERLSKNVCSALPLYALRLQRHRVVGDRSRRRKETVKVEISPRPPVWPLRAGRNSDSRRGWTTSHTNWFIWS